MGSLLRRTVLPMVAFVVSACGGGTGEEESRSLEQSVTLEEDDGVIPAVNTRRVCPDRTADAWAPRFRNDDGTRKPSQFDALPAAVLTHLARFLPRRDQVATAGVNVVLYNGMLAAFRTFAAQADYEPYRIELNPDSTLQFEQLQRLFGQNSLLRRMPVSFQALEPEQGISNDFFNRLVRPNGGPPQPLIITRFELSEGAIDSDALAQLSQFPVTAFFLNESSITETGGRDEATVIAEALAAMQHLIFVELANMRLSDGVLEALQTLPLTRLHLSGTSGFSAAAMTVAFSNLLNLTELGLGATELTDDQLKSLNPNHWGASTSAGTNATSPIVKLELTGNDNLSAPVLQGVLSSLANLRTLILQRLNMANKLSALNNLPLSELDLEYARGLTTEQLRETLPTLTQLQSLNVESTSFPVGGVDALSTLPLTTLRLGGNPRIGQSRALRTLLPSLKDKLRSLDLASTGLTDKTLAVVKSYPLSDLDISNNPKLSEAALIDVVPTLTQLRVLTIRKCAGLTAAVIQTWRALPLEELTLEFDRFEERLTEEALVAEILQLPHLRRLQITTWFARLSSAAVGRLQQQGIKVQAESMLDSPADEASDDECNELAD